MWLLLKNILFTLVAPGGTAVLLPYWVLSASQAQPPDGWGAAQLAAAPVGLAGFAVYLRCVWDFARRGRATPAPIDPPRVLVVQGLYRYVRNPMYLGVLLVILGEVLYFESMALALYAAAWWLVVHLFVLLYEERTLSRRFGRSYDTYRHSVGRWMPGPPYVPDSFEGPG